MYTFLGAIFLVHSAFCQTDTEDGNNCECITQWGSTEIDCSVSTINTLESFLTSDHLHCFDSCDESISCQQAFSLFTQYYNACPLGSVSQNIMGKFRLSTCTHCNTQYYYNDADVPPCASTNCTHIDMETLFLAHDQLDCPDENATCTDQCQTNWQTIASFQRQCDPYPLDDLYNDSSTTCTTDCNINDSSTDAVANCDDVQYAVYSKLNITDLFKQLKLCFYGLNIDDPTSYDLVCVDRATANQSGILSYSPVPDTANVSFWSAFGIAHDMNIVWIVLCAAIVFFMQLGFTLLEAGSVKASSVQNIMFKNLMDAAIVAIVYWVVGYSVAYGDPDSPDANGFMGVENILIEDETWGNWFFQMSFACTASTIVSGAVAERTRLEPYFIYTIIVAAWIYPVVAHWIWSETGWISATNPNPALYAGCIDFAGSSVVHMIGGCVGIIGAYFVGPRFRRFDHSEEAKASKYYKELHHQFEVGSNVPFQVLGLFILWFGFYAFNPGSTLVAQGKMDLASKVAVNTTLSAAAGGLTSAFMARFITGEWRIPKLCNGLLAALASITAGCATTSSGFAILIGFVGALLYYGTSALMLSKYVEIDDPLDAFAVHGVPGIWGVLSAALFSTKESLKFAGYSEAMYAGTTVGERFATNLTLVVVVFGWAMVNGALVFGFMSYLDILRVTEDEERMGMDVSKHGGKAVNMEQYYTQRGQQRMESLRAAIADQASGGVVEEEQALMQGDAAGIAQLTGDVENEDELDDT
eukprot:293157_1